MRDSSSSLIARIGFPKLMLLLSGLTVVAAAPAIYFSTKEAPKVESNKVDEIGDIESSIVGEMKEEGEKFVMKEDYFGQSERGYYEPMDGFDPSPPKKQISSQVSERPKEEISLSALDIFTETPKPVALKKEEVVAEKTKEIAAPKADPRPKSEVIKHAEKAPEAKKNTTLELLADKDYPSTIASKPYDLSRVLTTDSFIPAVMYTAVNSEIPSKTVLAIVESDVAGFHGTNILIPKGSKIEGTYEKIDNKHARRMQITWFKITRPDGIIIKLDAESSDVQGASGITGYLDQRLKDRYGGAMLLSTINALAQLSVKENDVRQMAAVESFGREFGTLTAQIIRENMNAMPIIMIRQGTRFNIRPYQNIYFNEPEQGSVKSFFIEKNQ